MDQPASWQSYWISRLVRLRMRPHALKPIDPELVRDLMGRPRWVRQLMARSTGAFFEKIEPRDGWPGGERLTSPRFEEAGGPVLLYLHGGGFIGCSPETHRSLAGSLAMRLGAQVWVPAYRLAPEHVYPAALEDALAAYRYLLTVAKISQDRFVVAGDSAGGGLAISTVLAARDQGYALPKAVVAYSPWTDLAATGASIEENSEKCSMFAGITIKRAAEFYAGTTDKRTPLLSPLYASFDGFPPLLVHASTDEVLRDDSIRIVEAVCRDGGQAQIRLWKRVPHVWQFFSAVLPEAQESLAETRQFIESKLCENTTQICDNP